MFIFLHFIIYDVIIWETNNYSKHCPISQKVKGIRQQNSQFIEYNVSNIFLEKSYTKCGQTSPRPFSKKKQNWVYPLEIPVYLRNFIVFFVCPSRGLPCWSLASTSNKAFLKHKNGSGNSLPASFTAWFF